MTRRAVFDAGYCEAVASSGRAAARLAFDETSTTEIKLNSYRTTYAAVIDRLILVEDSCLHSFFFFGNQPDFVPFLVSRLFLLAWRQLGFYLILIVRGVLFGDLAVTCLNRNCETAF